MKSLDQIKALIKRKWKIKRIGYTVFIEGPKAPKEKTGTIHNLFHVSMAPLLWEHERNVTELAEALKDLTAKLLTDDLTESILPLEVDDMKTDKPKNCTVNHIWHWWPSFEQLIMDKRGNLTGVKEGGTDVHLYKRYNIEDWPEGESIIKRDEK